MSTQEKSNPVPRPFHAHFVAAAMLLALVAMPLSGLAKEPATRPAASSMPMEHGAKMGAHAHGDMSMTGDVNYDFAVNMRKHHQMGVMMAEAQLKKSKDAVLRKMATKIIAAQNKEIAELDRWIAAHARAKPSPSAH